MPEENTAIEPRTRRIRHKGRSSQVLIYLGKQLRFFINESDWKVLPMAAVIAALVGMVIRKRFFINMEGALLGAFALACVALWNGCFNSIQSVCRERAIIKREHRSGMHVSAYVTAHMIYQLMLCALQTVISIYVLKVVGVQFPDKGFMTPWMMLDVGITMLLISYAADMMSLFLSSIARTTTGAMTLMPFVLIFQLVFSGGIIPLPAWSAKLSNFTISNYGIRALAAQSGYNELPMESVWQTLSGMRETEVNETIRLGEVLDILDKPIVESRRGLVLLGSDSEDSIIEPFTVGDLVDSIKGDEALQARRNESFKFKFKVQDLFDVVGEERLKSFVRDKTSEAAWKKEYERTTDNIVHNWLMLGAFIAAFAALSVLVLEFIDRDKR